MVKLLSYPVLILATVTSLLLFVVNSSEGKMLNRRSDEQLCGAANYFVCPDNQSCCPNGFLCQDNTCVKDDATSTSTYNIIITITASPTPKPKSSLSTGVIAGIAAGGFVLLLLVGIAIFFCVKQRKMGKEVLKAYEDPNRNLYDRVVVEGKRISVKPVEGQPQLRQQQQQQQQQQPPAGLPPLSETQGFEVAAIAQTSPQQYQAYQTSQGVEFADQQKFYGSEIPSGRSHVPEALRVGSPVSPLRADSMGLIPVGSDSQGQRDDQNLNQNPYPTSVMQTGMVHQHSIPPQPTSPPPQTVSPPPQQHSPVYHVQGYPPPVQGYPPRDQAYSPPAQGYPPPAQGYPPRDQAYSPPVQGYPPPTQGYPPQQTYYQPQETAYQAPSPPPGAYTQYPHYQR